MQAVEKLSFLTFHVHLKAGDLKDLRLVFQFTFGANFISQAGMGLRVFKKSGDVLSQQFLVTGSKFDDDSFVDAQNSTGFIGDDEQVRDGIKGGFPFLLSTKDRLLNRWVQTGLFCRAHESLIGIMIFLITSSLYRVRIILVQ
ncbi:hypothetical protein SDC9_151783 [bioreactor metagenome]|uniref:Uncharacterized protein n=1 Tax=bioreactor metagenome TaxID=1076179 RepID=A0A645ETJ7_9ZZZZ